MGDDLCAGLQVDAEQVSVEVASQQNDLEEQHATGPDGWATTKPRQNESANQGLDLKKQKSAYKNGQGETEHGSPSVGEGRTLQSPAMKRSQWLCSPLQTDKRDRTPSLSLRWRDLATISAGCHGPTPKAEQFMHALKLR